MIPTLFVIALITIVAAFIGWARLTWGQRQEPAEFDPSTVPVSPSGVLQSALPKRESAREIWSTDISAVVVYDDPAAVPQIGTPHPTRSHFKMAYQMPGLGTVYVVYRRPTPTRITPAISRRRWAAYKPKVA